VIIPVNYAQVNIKFTGIALPTGAEVTLGINRELYTGTPADLAQKVLVYFQSAAIRAQISSEVTINSCLAKFGPNSTGPAAEYTAPLAGTGAAAGSTPQVSWLARKNTGFGGRTGRGRMYIPGLPEPLTFSSGTIIAANVTSMTTALEAFRASLVADGCVPTLLHAPLSPVQVPMPITSFSVDNRAATQRRRLRR
jgi:hypothetical protein